MEMFFVPRCIDLMFRSLLEPSTLISHTRVKIHLNALKSVQKELLKESQNIVESQNPPHKELC
ncbi:hypothetical protein RchiOBHm_Chr7g0194571 [Rosa chinensis]|uniref:Uncharacterized protein n=1 Tax=Rosa chinensis TaxID=74649 RepID=A0A2P6P639_ROSCH|nr:hypothetical protein RchiOBHm_Chr7g0194571 [Rosa chinensis]